MKKLRFTSAILLGDFAVFYSSLAVALLLRRPRLFSVAYFLHHAAAFTCVVSIWLTVNSILGMYSLRETRKLSELISNTLFSFGYTLMLAVTVFYVFSDSLMTPKTYLVLNLGLASVLAYLWRWILVKAASNGFLAQRIAFIGSNKLMKYMEADLRGHRHSQFIFVSPYKLVRWYKHNKKTPGKQNHSSLRQQVDIVVVAAEKIELNRDYGKALVSLAMTEDIPLWVDTDFYEYLYKKISPEHASKPTWLFSNVLHDKKEVYFYFKRIFDVIFSLLAILVASPIFAITAGCIWALDGRPIFYAQKRLGYRGREFQFWKLRTMNRGVDKMGYLWNVSGFDPRITKLGRWLRRTRLDEIPQLWNILKGDMSFVGPRPTWVGEKQALDMPIYHLRHLVKPGLTGWAQINYRSTDSIEDTVEKLAYDFYYVKHISWTLDIVILLQTTRRIFQSENKFRSPRAEFYQIPLHQASFDRLGDVGTTTNLLLGQPNPYSTQN